MMAHVAELVVRVAELAEAEGRDLRRVVGRVGSGFSFSLVAGGLLLVGCGLVLAGMWIGLAAALNPAWASVLTGVSALALGVTAHKISERFHQ